MLKRILLLEGELETDHCLPWVPAAPCSQSFGQQRMGCGLGSSSALFLAGTIPSAGEDLILAPCWLGGAGGELCALLGLRGQAPCSGGGHGLCQPHPGGRQERVHAAALGREKEHCWTSRALLVPSPSAPCEAGGPSAPWDSPWPCGVAVPWDSPTGAGHPHPEPAQVRSGACWGKLSCQVLCLPPLTWLLLTLGSNTPMRGRALPERGSWHWMRPRLELSAELTFRAPAAAGGWDSRSEGAAIRHVLGLN